MESRRTGPWIEYMLLANHTDSEGGRIYVSGGGLRSIERRCDSHGEPLPNHLGIMLGFRFPAGIRVQLFHVRFRIVSVDADTVTEETTIQVHPELHPEFSDSGENVLPLVLNLETTFPQTGSYYARATLDNGSERRCRFRVTDSPSGPHTLSLKVHG